MTRKDYKIIASVFKYTLDNIISNDDHDLLFQMAEKMADELKKDNPNFKPKLFSLACGF